MDKNLHEYKVNRVWAFTLIVTSITIGTFGFWTWQIIEHDRNITQVELKRLERE